MKQRIKKRILYYFIYMRVADKWVIHDVTPDKNFMKHYKEKYGKLIKVRRKFKRKPKWTIFYN